MASNKTTCDIYRPIGDVTPTFSAIECTITSAFLRPPPSVQGKTISGPPVDFTHYIEVPGDTDIRDALTRNVNQFIYADGDEVRIPDAAGTRYVVVYVERIYTPPGSPDFKRAYLFREEAIWPGP